MSWLYRLIPGAFGTFVMFMMQVKAPDAVVNFCDWGKSDLIARANSYCLTHLTPELLRAFALVLIVFSIVLLIFPLLSLLRRFLNRSPWSSTAVTEEHLTAYIRSSPLIQKLDDQIAAIEQLPIGPPDGRASLADLESAKLFGISDIALLDKLLDENQEAVIRLSSYGNFEDKIPRGISLLFLFDVLGVQLGDENFRKLNMLTRFRRMSESGVQERIDSYRTFRKNHRVKIRVPFVDDFNLIPIEDGLQIARARCGRSAFAETLSSTGRPEDELLAYFNRFKDRMMFYGTIRGRAERMPIGIWPQFELFPPPMHPMSPAVQNPRFERGKIIVDSQLFREKGNGSPPSAVNVTYENLYVLRSTLKHAIDRLMETGIRAGATAPDGIAKSRVR